jgi:DNA-binding LacI/PurR family transcriptional regulator
VLVVAEELGYQRNPIARAFSRRRTSTLEIVVPTLTRQFYMEILSGVETALAATDYAIVIHLVEGREDRERVLAACCRRGRADGVLLIAVAPSEEIVDRVVEERLPTVLVDRMHPLLPSVVVDYQGGVMAAVRHCLGLGHRRIALVHPGDDPLASVEPNTRLQSFRAALAEAGLQAPPDYEQGAELTPEGGAAAAERLLNLSGPPTAILAGNDPQAMGMIDVARQRGKRIPDDLSIVGFNDIQLASYLGLTTVRVHMRELGSHAVGLLLDAIERGEPVPARSMYLPTELVVRRTCGPPGNGQG